jgi:hypothetical protein
MIKTASETNELGAALGRTGPYKLVAFLSTLSKC